MEEWLTWTLQYANHGEIKQAKKKSYTDYASKRWNRCQRSKFSSSNCT